MKELKDIKGYEGDYAVSPEGKVWSYKSKRWLTPCNNGSGGYWYVCLIKDGVKRKLRLHRLVAEAYIPNPEGKKTVNHIDENKSNNSVGNLEWVTLRENINHGTHNERVSNALKKLKRVRCIETGEEYSDAGYAAMTVNRSAVAMRSCLKGYTKTCAGKHWEYIEEE